MDVAQAGTQRNRWVVERYVDAKISRLQAGILNQSGRQWAAAQLAQLRRAVGKLPGSTPEIWSVEFEGLPEVLLGKGSRPSSGEWAVHAAITLYAVHQQSQMTGMYRATVWDEGEYHDIGNAVRALAQVQTEELVPGQMPHRLSAMVTAESIEEVLHYARQLVQQLRSKAIPLDYARFAGQLFDYQNPYRRDAVRLEWGREYARQPKKTSTEEA